MIDTADFNDEGTRAEVVVQFQAYETALRTHDVGALNAFFLDRGDTVRFGVAEEQLGASAVASWRSTARPVHPLRKSIDVVVVTYGPDIASVSAQLREPDVPGLLRQTQLWIRTARGWKIAAAHVSVRPD